MSTSASSKRDPSALLTRVLLPAVVAITVATAWLRWLASDRGVISDAAGVAFMTAFAVVVFTVLAFWSARKLRAAAARERRAERDDLYRMVARSFPSSGMFVFDRDLRYVLVEGRSLAEVGLAAEAMEGRLLAEILTGEERETVEPVYRAALAGETTTSELEFRGQHYRVSVAPTRDDDGEIVGGMALTQRITDEKALRDQIHQLQKMEAVGQLAGGVAHDFNNLLHVIRGYGELARSQPGDDRGSEWLDEIVKASDQATALTRQLLAFSRRQVLQPRLLNVNDLVVDTLTMLERVLGGSIEIVTALDPGLGAVLADPGHVNQVLMNLAVNARDAMPAGGRLTVETANVTLDDAFARDHVGAEPGRYVMLAATDSGIGMDKETSLRIFEPFFTTKPEGQGTGLGLSTVYGIVTQSDGYVSVYSELGWGSVFRVYLPLVADEVPAAEPERVGSPARAAGGRILVVDDDAGVRGIISTMLHAHGFDAEAVAGADEAIARAEATDFDLLLTDLVNPGANGLEIAELLVQRQPHITVLYMSGYTPRTIEEGLPQDARFLPKPFTARQLVDAVGEALAR